MAKSVALLFMVIILLLCIFNVNGLNEEKENSYLSKRNPRRRILQGGGGNDPSGQPPTTKPKTRKPTPSPAR